MVWRAGLKKPNWPHPTPGRSLCMPSIIQEEGTGNFTFSINGADPVLSCIISAKSVHFSFSQQHFPILVVVMICIFDAVFIVANVLSNPGVINTVVLPVEYVFYVVDHVCEVFSILTVSDLLMHKSNSNTWNI